MTQEIRSCQTTIPNGDLQVAAYLAEPITPSSSAAVIVIQEIFGVNAHIRSVTDRWAELGCVVIAPAIFQPHSSGV